MTDSKHWKNWQGHLITNATSSKYKKIQLIVNHWPIFLDHLQICIPFRIVELSTDTLVFACFFSLLETQYKRNSKILFCSNAHRFHRFHRFQDDMIMFYANSMAFFFFVHWMGRRHIIYMTSFNLNMTFTR